MVEEGQTIPRIFIGVACLSAFPFLGPALVALVRPPPTFAVPSTSNALSGTTVGAPAFPPRLTMVRSRGKPMAHDSNGITEWLDSPRAEAGKSPGSSMMTTWPALSSRISRRMAGA